MAVAFRAFSSQVVESDPVTTALPTGTAQNDLLLLHVSNSQIARTLTTPSGYTLISGPNNAPNSGERSWLYWKVAGASEAAPSLDFDAAPASGQWMILGYQGNDTTTPINRSNFATSASTATPTTPAITLPTVDNCMLVAFMSQVGQSVTGLTQGTGFTERADIRPSISTSCSYAEEKLQTTATSEAASATASTAADWGTYIVAIAPSGPATPAPTLMVVRSNLVNR